MKVYREHTRLAEMLAASPESAAEAELQQEVKEQAAMLLEYGYLDPCDMMCVVELERNDDVASLEDLMGLTILRNRWTAIQYGCEGFTPSWETVERYDHWYVVVFVMSDDGFGYLVFVPKDNNSPLPRVFEEYLSQSEN